jgi:hypothetical protein
MLLVATPYAGPTPCYLLPFVLKGGKTMRGGRVAYSGALRSLNPVLCMQRALGYHMVHRFTLTGVSFPDPRKPEEWYSAALFPTTDPSRNITYEQLHANLKELLADLDIVVTKVTHIFRVGGARFLDQCGVDDQVRIGGRMPWGWQRRRELCVPAWRRHLRWQPSAPQAPTPSWAGDWTSPQPPAPPQRPPACRPQPPAPPPAPPRPTQRAGPQAPKPTGPQPPPPSPRPLSPPSTQAPSPPSP